MTHKFNPANMSRLESPERYRMLPPGEILEKSGLRDGDVFADIGSGTGFFAIPASRVVGPEGKVLAVDTSLEMNAELTRKITAEKLSNIEVIHSGEYDLTIPDGSADVALLSHVLHEVDDKNRMLKEIHRALRPGGRAVTVEWTKKETPKGPPVHERVGEDEVIAELKALSFSSISAGPVSESNYFVTAVK